MPLSYPRLPRAQAKIPGTFNQRPGYLTAWSSRLELVEQLLRLGVGQTEVRSAHCADETRVRSAESSTATVFCSETPEKSEKHA